MPGWDDMTPTDYARDNHMPPAKVFFLIVAWGAFALLLAVTFHPILPAQLLQMFIMAAITISFYLALWLFPKFPIPVVPNISVLFVAAVVLGRFPELCIVLLTAPFLIFGMRHVWRLALFFPAEDALSTMFGYVGFKIFGGTAGYISLSQWGAYLAFWAAYFIANIVLIPAYYSAGTKKTLKAIYLEQILSLSAVAMNIIDLIFGFIMIFAMKDMGIAGVIFISVALWLVNANYRFLLRSLLQSQRDELTGLHNRRYFTMTLEKHFRKGREISLLMLDLDNFKTYNDTCGHVKGDKLLQEVAQLVSASVGSRGAVCRYGGEEFAIILPNMPVRDAFAHAERIRRAISSRRFAGMEVMPHGRITVSIGVASYPELAKDVEQLIQQADEALYKVKFKNKNESLIYSSSV